MSIEGKLEIIVNIKNNKIQKTDIKSTRPLYMSKLLKHKTINEVGEFINLVYHLCNNAHRFAFLKLLHKTNYINLSKKEVLAYQLLLDLETIKEHAFTIFSKWNSTLNAEFTYFLKNIETLKTKLFVHTDPFSIKDKKITAGLNIKKEINVLEKLLLAFFIGDKNELSALENITSFNNWINTSNKITAKFFEYLIKNNYAKLANVSLLHLEKNMLKSLENLLNDDFIKKPHYKNKFYETTPLSRYKNYKLIKELNKIYKNGLLVRFTAQLIEIFALLTKIKKNYKKIKKQNIHYRISTNKATAITKVNAARGMLIHKMVIDNNIIDYKILAPTEWNFHPQGVLTKMIKTLDFDNENSFLEKLNLLISAIDPCVDYKIKINY